MNLKIWRKAVLAMLTLVLVGSLLAACSGGNSESSAETRVLRIGVLYGGEDNDPWFRQQYTDSFELMNNGRIEIEIVPAINYNSMNYTGDTPQEQPDPYEEMKKLLEGDNPVDVMVLDHNYLRRAVLDNLLKELDPLIQQDNFDISDYVPAVIDGIKAAGDNKIYALTPTFTSSALFYNKKLFTEAGMTPPTDNMNWDDVFNLARNISKGEGSERVFGLMLNRWGGDGFWDMQTYSAPLQLRMVDDTADNMTVNTDQWKRVWTAISGLYKEKIIPRGEDIWGGQDGMMGGNMRYNPYSGDLFLSGRVAMMVGDYYYLNDLRRADQQKDSLEDFEMVEWDVVTIPEHMEMPGVGGNIYLSSLMGINTKAQNSDDAWAFIKFLNGKEWARLKARSTNELVAREEFIKPREGMDYNIAAFYKMIPVPPQNASQEELFRKYPNLYEATYYPGQMLFNEVIEETKTVEEALAEWETQGNARLKEIKENPGQSLNPLEPAIMEEVYMTDEMLLEQAAGETAVETEAVPAE